MSLIRPWTAVAANTQKGTPRMGVIDGRVAIVTGGGRGIGASISRLFAAEGAAVVVNDLGGSTDGTGSDDGPAMEIAEEIVATGGRAVADGGDIADVATGERLVRTAVQQFGRLDIVVNVAGILRDRMIFNLPEADWDAVIRVHLKGHYSTARPAAAYFREQRNPDGHYRIINFTSVSGLDGSPGQPNYAAAKMGIVGLTYSLAQGLARYGVTANAIAPGAATRMTATVPSGKWVVREGGPSPEDPVRSPDNVAPVALYLASEQSDWLTGRVISARGYDVGLYANPEIIRQLSAPGPWDYEKLAEQMERSFRPVADGLPRSLFASQLQTG
jgi:NAD(P)-dependent dehydrogenase (short-subunit alcohol dehydrogenase family)